MSIHVMPGATYRPVEWAEARDDATNPDHATLHLQAGEARSLFTFFSNPANRACSHFHVARDGYTEQYISGDKLSAADSYGSDSSLSIETQGADAGGTWTDEQCEAIARILAWAHRTYDIPLVPMATSHQGVEGVGWHRLGVDGNFPALPSILAGRIQRGGGESWSGAFGKLCPGDNRIKQIPGIIARAKEIVAGSTPQEDDMFTDKDREGIAELRKAISEINARTIRDHKILTSMDDRLGGSEDGPSLARLVINSTLTPAQIAAAVPAGLAQAVVDELNRRLEA